MYYGHVCIYPFFADLVSLNFRACGIVRQEVVLRSPAVAEVNYVTEQDTITNQSPTLNYIFQKYLYSKLNRITKPCSPRMNIFRRPQNVFFLRMPVWLRQLQILTLAIFGAPILNDLFHVFLLQNFNRLLNCVFTCILFLVWFKPKRVLKKNLIFGIHVVILHQHLPQSRFCI